MGVTTSVSCSSDNFNVAAIKMKSSESRLALFIAPIALIALLFALGYSQVGWRRDRKVYETVRERLNVVSLQRTFPADGEELGASALRVIRGADTIPLAQLVRGRKAVIYFGRPDCPSCTWFTAKMDSIFPAWRDSIIEVTSFSKERGVVAGLTLDSASSLVMTGVPAILVVDEAGFVRHSVDAGLPAVTRVLDFVGIPSPSAIRGSGAPHWPDSSPMSKLNVSHCNASALFICR